MAHVQFASKLRHLGRESCVVAAGASLVCLAALRLRSGWLDGVIGGGDAWQNLWNLHHVDRALRSGGPLLYTHELWAPEGASLVAHTLSLTNTVPGALVGRLVGFAPAYNLLVALSFVLAAVASYRLARRLGAGVLGSCLGAFVFAFAPQRMARTLGHLNLLGSGWIPLALEGLLIASSESTRHRWRGVAVASAALVALVYCDWYLAILGALASVAFGAFELSRARPGRRGRTAVPLLAVAAIALAASVPVAVPLARASTGEYGAAHQARYCSVAVTSLFVPGRMQWVSRFTRPLTRLNSQGIAEGAGYLGLVPLAATIWLVSTGQRRPRQIDFALAAGAVALVLSLGPQPRFFDHWVRLPLPYGWIESIFPALRMGGCVSRLEQLVSLPLGLGVAFTVDRLRAMRSRAPRAVMALGALVLVAEYAPTDPGVSRRPYSPADPAMQAVAASPIPGGVLDLETGVGALIRQLRHGRPQTFGYLSRVPRSRLAPRLADPVLGPILDDSRPAAGLPRAAVAELLRHRWGVAFVIAPANSPLSERAKEMGFDLFSASDASVAYRVPDEAPEAVEGVDTQALSSPSLAARRGVFVWGCYGLETVGVPAGTLRGKWTSREASILAPLRPGPYTLVLAAPRPSPATVHVEWGRLRHADVTVKDVSEVPIDVQAADLADDGTLWLRIRASTFRPEKDDRDLGVFLVGLHADHREAAGGGEALRPDAQAPEQVSSDAGLPGPHRHDAVALPCPCAPE